MDRVIVLIPFRACTFVNMYGNHWPMIQWIDDLEVWDIPPCGVANLPCGPGTVVAGTCSEIRPLREPKSAGGGIVAIGARCPTGRIRHTDRITHDEEGQELNRR